MKATGALRAASTALVRAIAEFVPTSRYSFPAARFRVDKASRPKRTCLAIVAGAVRDAIAAALASVIF